MDTSTRWFTITSEGDLDVVYIAPFHGEYNLRSLIKKNIDKLFPGLVTLREFAEIRDESGKLHKPDMVAFDSEKNTFVVIEYKNRWDVKVLDQVWGYLKHMERSRDEFENIYLKQAKGGGQPSFDWNKAYAIIVSSVGFTVREKGLARSDHSLQLYNISKRLDRPLSLAPVELSKERPVADPEYRLWYETIRAMVIIKYGYAAVKKDSKTCFEFPHPTKPGVCRVSYSQKHGILFEHYYRRIRVMTEDEFEDVLPGVKEYITARKRLGRNINSSG